MEKFKLDQQEYIELNKLLKILSWVPSGGEANMVIVSGMVTWNGEIEIQKRKKVRIGDVVQFQDASVQII